MFELPGLTYYSKLKTLDSESLEVRSYELTLLVYKILFGVVHVNSRPNAFFTLRNQLHLRGHKYVMVKQCSVNRITESFFQ